MCLLYDMIWNMEFDLTDADTEAASVNFEDICLMPIFAASIFGFRSTICHSEFKSNPEISLPAVSVCDLHGLLSAYLLNLVQSDRTVRYTVVRICSNE